MRVMFDDDTLNPRFVHFSFLRAGDSVISHVDRAIEAWQGFLARSVIRESRIEALQPILGAQTIRVDLWVEDFDDSSCVYGFLCSSENGCTPFARGDRSITNHGARWSDAVRERVATLRKDLPAYA